MVEIIKAGGHACDEFLTFKEPFHGVKGKGYDFLDR